VFSSSVEVVLTIAYREAVSRRHAYLTLEHLLYVLAHDPDGERILAACGADLPALRRALDQASQDCLAPYLRQTYLDEEPRTALDRYGTCERQHGRSPYFTGNLHGG